MAELRPVGIIGTGGYAPKRVLSNADFEKLIDTTDEWITTRTGIKERRILDEGESTSTMAINAARQALEDAELDAGELDMIVVATVTGDMTFPSTACLVQRALGASKAAAMDVQAACAGFLYALSVGTKFIQTGSASKVLVIGAEALSVVTNYKDRASCILFGDGAGCMLLSSEFERGRILDTSLHADGNGAEVIQIPAGGSLRPMTHEALDNGDHLMQMRGREVYKFAVARFVELTQRQIDAHPDLELGLVIPHQVNKRIIDSARERLGLPEEQVYSNIVRYGNTSAASIPIAFNEVRRAGMLDDKQGKLVVFCAFGAGLVWASGALQW